MRDVLLKPLDARWLHVTNLFGPGTPEAVAHERMLASSRIFMTGEVHKPIAQVRIYIAWQISKVILSLKALLVKSLQEIFLCEPARYVAED